MNALATSFLVTACVFAGGLAGLHLTRFLPQAHMTKDTQDVIRLGTGMLSVLASLVLGLLIATVKTSFDNSDTAVRAYSADLTMLDATLRNYGDEALSARRQLRDYTRTFLHNTWPDHGASPFLVEHREAGEMLEGLRDAIRSLAPANADQRWLADQALQVSTSLMRQRWLSIERSEPSVRPVMIVILVCWVVAIFASFGLNAPCNATVYAAFLVCALAIGSSIFLILELDSPFDGAMQISSRPVEAALAHMLP